MKRRGFLAGALGAGSLAFGAPLLALAAPELLPAAKGRRVVIVGGGWGGLACARRLRSLAPALEVVLIEKNATFWSCPLSNKWLADLVATRYLAHDYAAAAAAYGYSYLRAEVTAVDRESRRLFTAAGSLAYDWLVLAPGIRHDYGAWFGDERRAAEEARSRYPSAYGPAEESAALKRKLAAFAGGDLVMTVPPLPYRCPTAPYERASLIGWLLKSRRIKGRLIILDPNPISPSFRRIIGERYREQIVLVEDARVTSVDPFARKVFTEFDEYRFDDAILMPPQQAGDLLWQAGLIGRDRDGKPTGWADQDPLHLHARGDERIFLVGDVLGAASPLFGYYPKSGHMAARQGGIVAAEIAARAQGKLPPRGLPESICYVFPDFEPPDMLRIEAHYRLRGDGLIEQTSHSYPDHNPRGEDLAWATAMFADFLAFKP